MLARNRTLSPWRQLLGRLQPTQIVPYRRRQIARHRPPATNEARVQRCTAGYPKRELLSRARVWKRNHHQHAQHSAGFPTSESWTA